MTGTIRVWDYIAGLEIPLLEGYGLGSDWIYTMAVKSGSLLTGYGAARFRGNPQALVRQTITRVSRALAFFGASTSPRIEGGGGGYTVTFNLGGSRVISRIMVEPVRDGYISRYYTLVEGSEDPRLLEDMALSIEPAERAPWRRLEVVDPHRGLPAASILIPSTWGGSGWLTPGFDIAAKIEGGGTSITVGAERFVHASGPFAWALAQQAPMMGYKVGEYMDASTLASSISGWERLTPSWPPPLFGHRVAEALAYRMHGLWASVSSVLAFGDGVGWVSTVGYQMPGIQAIMWGSHYAIATGRDALNHLLVIMAHARVNEDWYKRVVRDNVKLSRMISSSFRSRPSPSYTPPPSTPSYSYDSYDYSTGYDTPDTWGDDYQDYDGYDTGYSGGGYDDYDNEPGDAGYGDYGDEWGERRSRLRRYMDEPDTQFYVDQEGMVRAYDGEEDAVASYIDESGYLRDEEHRVIGRVEHGYVYDEETGERVGILNVDASDDYRIREFEDRMLNPREQLGYDMFGPSEDEKPDIDPTWVSRKRSDKD
ncbi:MAG: hypothetical protein GSR84_00740 [Desulfurococcales archaeon]|nr:hypothetical protein [Desulfurococcales archaeon]